MTRPLDADALVDALEENAAELGYRSALLVTVWGAAVDLAERLRLATALRHDPLVVRRERLALLAALDGDLEMLPHPKTYTSEARAQLLAAASAAAVQGREPRRSMLVDMALEMHRRLLERELDALIDLTLDDEAAA